MISRSDVEAALAAVGIASGDVVYVHSALHKIGPTGEMSSRQAYLDMFLEAFRSVLGPNGTLVVPTFTTQVMRFGIDYVHERTPSLMGIFSEHIRLQKDSIRRLHPTMSFAALGPHAKFICENVTLRDAGLNSPYERMIHLGAKILSLGAGRIFAVSLVHHLEGMYGPPHIYNKLLTCKVFKDGQEIKLPFVLGARYLHLIIRYDLTRFADAVAADGGIMEAPLGRGAVFRSDMAEVFKIGSDMIRKDWFAFLAEPPAFMPGVLPSDGFTAKDEDIEAEPTNLIGYYL
jgi:aminoglycoside 3-N-acetyltransferase